MTFKYDKENLFKEFEVAKQKDIKLSKKDNLEDKENDIHKNRIKFLREHIELKKEHPEYYSQLDINFDNLLSTYLTTDPRETFYQKVFGRSYAEVRAESEPQSVND